MAALEDDTKGSKLLHALLGDLLSAVGTHVSDASDVSIVLRSLHPLALLFFSVPANSFSAVSREDDEAESGLIAIEKLAEACRCKAEEENGGKDVYQTLRHALYDSSHFPTLTTLLLNKIAADWLACFLSLGTRWLFDEFFRQAPPTETLLNLVPFLGPERGMEEKSDVGLDSRTAVSAQAKRLLEICLVQLDGVKEIGLSFGQQTEQKLQEGGFGNIGRASWLKDIFQVAQLIASIPDRAGHDSPTALQSPVYFESVLRQLLSAGEKRWEQLRQIYSDSSVLGDDGTFLFIGEVISRLCRRGQAGVIATIFLPALMQHVKQVISKLEVQSDLEMTESALQVFKISSERNLWTGVSLSIKDSHAMEKWVGALLREMLAKIETDMQAFCVLWMAFGSLLSKHSLTRMVFLDKCLFVKILPIRCLRWVLQFGVLHNPTALVAHERLRGKRELQMNTEVVSRLAQVWSSNDFIRSASLPKQAYLTAAVGICLRSMNKEDIGKCGDLMRSILQGVTNRLDSPLSLIREMAKRLALGFSLVMNPAKPLLLDGEDQVKDLDNWDDLSLQAVIGSKEENYQVGTAQSTHVVPGSIQGTLDSSSILADPTLTDGVFSDSDHHERQRQRKERREKMALEEDDPDAVVNLGQDNAAWLGEPIGSAADSSSDIGSDDEGSLLPYDMSDDESELDRRKLPSQLRDCAADLRKSDDPDAVEKSLQVAEQMIRAMPVELNNTAEELAQALVHVRPGANAVEGEEDKLENQRHGALVALLACAPLSSIVIVTQEIFSPHLDISQRLLLLDAMSDAAQELAGKLPVQPSGQRPHQGLVTELAGASHQSSSYGSSRNQEAGPWSELPALMPGNSMVGWAQRFERELPLRKSDRRLGTSRKWAPRSMQLREERQSNEGLSSHQSSGKNLFASLAAAFMLPIMRDYDKKAHGVDFLESGFIVLGKILYTLGVCMECITAQPEAVVLGANLLELLRSRAVANHPESYVRRAALFAASRVIIALHPSQVATAITGTDSSIASELEWVREWALGIANNDPDSDCAKLAMACVQLHSEMALQAMRAIQSTPSNSQSRIIQTIGERSIIMPF